LSGLHPHHHGHDGQLDDATATRRLRNGLISLAILVALVIGLLLAVPGLHHVAHEVTHMAIPLVVAAVLLEVLSCVCYIIAFLQVFERAPIRLGARVALSELAFGAAVSLGGAGSVAVGAWLLVERGANPGRVAERSAVLFLLTSAVNVITLAVVGIATGVGIIPGSHNLLLTLVPGLVAVVVLLAFLALPRFVDSLVGNRKEGRLVSLLRGSAESVRDTAVLLRRPDWRLVGAFGYLWFDIAVLELCFQAAGGNPPLSTLVLAYQIGYLSNFLPIPGGIGVLDGSFVGMFVLYHVNASIAAAATLVYHAISLWVPGTWGTVAFLLLRRSRNQPLRLRKPRHGAV
jgi:uncharacterized membrane protein YbhN (UPF0104 family)